MDPRRGTALRRNRMDRGAVLVLYFMYLVRHLTHHDCLSDIIEVLNNVNIPNFASLAGWEAAQI
jgi:hypothetical protein